MSIEAMAYVKSLHIPSSPQKLIMLLIADRINNETGEAYPGQALLARESSLGERSVRGHLRALEEAGLLTRRKRFTAEGKADTDLYSIAGYMDWLVCARECAESHRQKSAGGKNQPAADSRQNRRQVCAETGGKNLPPNPKRNPKRTQNAQTGVCADGCGGSKTDTKPAGKQRKAAKRPNYTEDFERFWQQYPQKRGKAEAAKTWAALSAEDREAAKIGIGAYVSDCKQNSRPYRHGSTYLNQRTWEDYEDSSAEAQMSDEDKLVTLLVHYGRDPQNFTWGQRLREKYGPPPGTPECTLSERILNRAREILKNEFRKRRSSEPAFA